MVQPTTDEMNDITVFRELEKMKQWIIDNCYGKLVKNIKFSYGTGEHVNRIILTVTFINGTTISDSFDTITISRIYGETEGDIYYLVVEMTNGTKYRVPLDTSIYVTLDGDQTIGGNKNFTGDALVRDIVHAEGEELVQETNEAVNERFFKIHATERIDGLEDEIGDVSQEGTIRGDIAKNTQDISGLDERVTQAEGNITSLDGRVTQAEGNITSLDGRVTQAEGNIIGLSNRVTQAEGNITSLDGRVTQAEGNIIGLSNRVTQAEGDIDNLETNKQDALISGGNIKTVNGVSLLGSGDIPIATGGTWGSIGGEIGNQADLIQMINTKQDTLVSGSNLRTINSTSLLGSGNIAVQPTLVSGTNIKTVDGQSLLGGGNISVVKGGGYWKVPTSITELTNAILNSKAIVVLGIQITPIGENGWKGDIGSLGILSSDRYKWVIYASKMGTYTTGATYSSGCTINYTLDNYNQIHNITLVYYDGVLKIKPTVFNAASCITNFYNFSDRTDCVLLNECLIWVTE